MFRLLFVLLAFFPSTAFAVVLPANDGFLTDAAEVLTVEEEEVLEESLKQTFKSTNHAIVILTLPSIGDDSPEYIADLIADSWLLEGGDRNHAAFMLMSYEDRVLHIAPSSDTMDVLSEEVVQGIVKRDMIKLYRQGKYAESLTAGSNAVFKHLTGEWNADRYRGIQAISSFWIVIGIILSAAGAIAASFYGRLTRKWVGGILGAILGMFWAFIFGWWLSIPILMMIGLGADIAFVTQYRHEWMERRRMRRRAHVRNDSL